MGFFGGQGWTAKPAPPKGNSFGGNATSGSGGYSAPLAPAPARPSGPAPAAPAPQAGPNPGGMGAPGAMSQAAAAQSFMRSPAYAKTIANVFAQQAPHQQQAIIQGAQKNPSDPTSQAVLQYVKFLGANQGLKSEGIRFSGPTYSRGPMVSGYTSSGAPIVNFQGPQRTFQDKPRGSAALDVALAPIAASTAAIGALGQAAKNPAGFVSNLGKDAATFVPNTVQGLAKVGNQIGHGDLAGAAHSFFDPYVKLFGPQGANMLYQNPISTAMMAAGPEAAVGRGVGAVMRSGALGDAAKAAASTARAPLRLGQDVAGAANPLVENRSYSPNVLHKSIQTAHENFQRARGLDPNIARPAPALVPSMIQNALNIGLQAKTNRIADEMTAARQMGGREARATATSDARAAMPKDPVARNVVAHAVQGVLRTPETAIQDAINEINRLKAAQTGNRTRADFANRAQVRDLSRFVQRPDLVPHVFNSANALRDYFNKADAFTVSKGLLEPEQAMRSKLFPYAQAHMGATYDHASGYLAHHVTQPDGSVTRELLPTQAILDHLKANKVPDPAYVGHYPAKGGFWNYYRRYQAARGSLGNKPREGEAFRRGNYDHTYDALTAQAARTAEAISNASLHDEIVNRFGVGKPAALRGEGENGMWTPGEARVAAHAMSVDDHGNPIPGAQEWVAIPATPKSTLDAVSGIQHPSQLENAHGLELQAIERAMNEARSRNDGTRDVVLAPRAALERFGQQFKPSSDLGRKVGAVTQQFRRTVLPYSTHWMGQIGTEALLRSVLGGVFDPRSLVAGHQLARELQQTERGRAILRETTNQTFYSKNDPLARHNPNPGPISAAAHTLPVSKHIIALHNRYANFIGNAMGGMEHQFRLMGLGKIARQELQEFTGRWQGGIKLQGKNVARLATEMKTNPAEVAKFGRQIDGIFGQYNKFTPRVRAMTQSVAPFLPWYLNAAKFVLWHLPVHHPVANSLLASLRQTVANDIANGQQAPLGKYAEEALARVTPFGILPQPETPNLTGAASELSRLGLGVLAPQASGALMALMGLDAFGQPLKGPSGNFSSRTGLPTTSQPKAFSKQAMSSALNAGIEAVLPGVRQAQVAREGGGKAYNTSTLWNPQSKPDQGSNLMQIINRIFNPLYSFKSAQAGDAKAAQNLLQKQQKQSSSGGGPSGTSGGTTGGLPPGLGIGGGGGSLPGLPALPSLPTGP